MAPRHAPTRGSPPPSTATTSRGRRRARGGGGRGDGEGLVQHASVMRGMQRTRPHVSSTRDMGQAPGGLSERSLGISAEERAASAPGWPSGLGGTGQVPTPGFCLTTGGGLIQGPTHPEFWHTHRPTNVPPPPQGGECLTSTHPPTHPRTQLRHAIQKTKAWGRLSNCGVLALPPSHLTDNAS